MAPPSRFGATKFRNAVPSPSPRETWPRTLLPSSATQSNSSTSSTLTFSSQIKTSRTKIYTLTPNGDLSIRLYPNHNAQVQSGQSGVWSGKVGNEVGDWDVSKVESGGSEIIALGSKDGKITVLSSSINSFSSSAPVMIRTISTPGPVTNLVLHPTTPNIAVVSSPNQSAIYELSSSSSSPTIILSPDSPPPPSSKAGLWSAAWSPDGRLLATITKTACLQVYDIRASPKPIQSRSLATSVQALKPARITFADIAGTEIFLTSFSKNRNREYSLYSTLKDLETTFTNSVDTNQGILIPLIDVDRRIIYATAKGDMTLRQIELSGPQGFQEMVHPLPFMVSSASIALSHQATLEVMKATIAEVLIPVVDKDGDAILPMAINVPRRHLIDFHEDLYPDIAGPVPEQTAEEWFEGGDKMPARIPLNPSHRAIWERQLEKISATSASSQPQVDPVASSIPNRSAAQPTSTPSAPPSVPPPTVAMTPPEPHAAPLVSDLASEPTPQSTPATRMSEAPTTASTEYKMSLIGPFIIEQLEAYKKTGATAPLMIGLQGPQGCGKTTLCNGLLDDMRARDKRVAVLSLDDLYRTNAELKELSLKHPNNALLSGRGPPGTHDVDLAVSVLDAISRINEPGAPTVFLPIFDKSLCGGEGDRSPSTIPIEGPLDVFVLEGWSMGFGPLPLSTLQSLYASPPSPKPNAPTTYFTDHSLESLIELNDYLATFASAVYPKFSAIVRVKPQTYEHVFKWRLEQEHMMKKGNGGKGMSDEQVKAFVKRYMPGYELWAESIGREETPWMGKVLTLYYGSNREVVKVEKGVARGLSDGSAESSARVAKESSTTTQALPTASISKYPTTAPALAPAQTQSQATTSFTSVGPHFNPKWSRKYLVGKSPLNPTYDQVPPISTLHQDSIIFKTTRDYAFFPIQGTGGRLGVHPLRRKGRMPVGGVGYLSGGVEMVDFDVEKSKVVNGARVAVAGEDGNVRVWKVKEDIEGAGPEPEVVLKGDKVDKIAQISFHPTAKDLLVMASNDLGKSALRFFDLKKNVEAKHVELDIPGIFNFTFSPYGTRVALATKNSQIIVLDPRDIPNTLCRGSSHDSPRSFQLAWIDETHLVSIGFARGSQRKINLYTINKSESSIKTSSSLTIDVSPSVLFPHYDPDTCILYVWGKGERVIHAFEIHPEDQNEPIAKISSFISNSGTPQLGVSFAPKSAVDVKKVEIALGLRLSAKSIEEVSFTIPRNKPEFFQDDIYVPTVDVESPVVEGEAWLNGENGVVRLINLQPEGMALLSTAPKATITKPKFVPAQDVMSEQEKKQREMDALFAKAKAGDSSDDDDEPPRSGLPPPDDDW